MPSDYDDPLTRPLALGNEPRSLTQRALRFLAFLMLVPLLPIALLLLPTLLLGAALYAAVFHPAMLQGLPRDIRFVVRLVRATRQLKQRLARSGGTFTTADYWAETVSAHGAKEALIFEGHSFSYLDVDRESNRVARWAMGEGVQARDTVALFCANRPEHLFIWLGLAKLGAATTLVNSALRGASLRHSLQQCAVRLILFDGASAAALAPLAAEDGDATDALRFVCVDADQTPAFATALALPDDAPTPPRAVRAACRSTDTLLHIFTSGTTGLPKAARLNHIRFFSAIVLPHMFDLRPTDRLYCCLPMCHTAAVGALSICWWLGAPAAREQRRQLLHLDEYRHERHAAAPARLLATRRERVHETLQHECLAGERVTHQEHRVCHVLQLVPFGRRSRQEVIEAHAHFLPFRHVEPAIHVVSAGAHDAGEWVLDARELFEQPLKVARHRLLMPRDAIRSCNISQMRDRELE